MNPKGDGSADLSSRSKSEKNSRPPTSTRATFALGQEAICQADRLARIASNFKPGGVSRSAVLRGLLRFAEDAALRSGDEIVARVLVHSDIPEGGILPELGEAKPEYAKLWERVRKAIVDS